MENERYHVFFFETFEEEMSKLQQSLDEKFKACYSHKTIQEWLLDEKSRFISKYKNAQKSKGRLV